MPLNNADKSLAGIASADNRSRARLVTPEAHRVQLEHLSTLLAKSLETERADYSAVVPWLRPLVVLRGLCDRALIHHRMQQCRRGVNLLDVARGTIAPGNPTLFGRTDDDPHPEWLTAATVEGRQLGAAIWRQVQARLTPRISAMS